MVNSDQKKAVKFWLNSSYLGNVDKIYIENLYKDFLINPDHIDSSWQSIFKTIYYKDKKVINKNSVKDKNKKIFSCFQENKISHFNSLLSEYKREFNHYDSIFKLINSFRSLGHKQANIDPLNLFEKENVPDLDINFYNFTKDDLQKEINISSYLTNNKYMKLNDLYSFFKETYCGSVGVEYMHISNNNEKEWIQKRIESGINSINFTHKEKIRFLKELIAAEELEHYLGNRFPGSKRFSLEGEEVLILVLKELIRYSTNVNIKEIILGMAHRGRLNVLINILGKKPKDLFDEFIDKNEQNSFNQYSGDVKYHQGFSSEVKFNNKSVHLLLSFNPSHLEIINPVIMGMVRARIDQSNEIDNYKVLPITIHGDAAISGQGVVQETLNMSRVRGYNVGGTIHIIINNQIGFTTNNCDIRSTKYCTDIAKMIEAPIFHVNADDPESAVFISNLALDFRNTFKNDVFIDLVGYRRHGHNEADDPNVTQPIMYQVIKNHPTLVSIYSNYLKNNKIINSVDISKMIHSFRSKLDNGECVIKELNQTNRIFTYNNIHNHNDNKKYDSNSNIVTLKNLQELAYDISKLPSNLKVQSRVSKIYEDRCSMAKGEKLFDWGGAELLAYATLLDKGFSIRLSGEDSVRGTFFHRHAIVFDQNKGTKYIPLTNIHNKQGMFSIWNSVLSEEAVLAFEYGYSIASKPNTLVIWEAQFGDFANGAQIVIDQFISSSKQKWGINCNIVMLLPHGYEGQGPEHSSARLERYLQLCAEHNMRICVPSTPKQMYHILRFQALNNINMPLILISPKSLLRHPMSTSSLNELVNGYFQKVIGEIDHINPQNIKRVIICYGKIYYDLLYQRRKNKQKNIAIIRIEQLYPFPTKILQAILSEYTHVKDIIWCQEEPKNQGAWYCSQRYLHKIIPSTSKLNYLGRSSSASPAVGYLSIHRIQQKKIINDALKIF